MPQMENRPDRDINLSTVERVEALLEEAAVPVSRAWILRELAHHGHATTRQRLNRALEYFFRPGLAVDGSKGVQWTHNPGEGLHAAVSSCRRL